MGIMDLPSPRPLYEIFVHSPVDDGDSFAWRQGGPGRDSLVRSARGDARRGIGLDEYPDDQKHLDRARRFQGWFCRQKPVRQAQNGRKFRWRRLTKILMHGMLDVTDNLVDGVPHRAAQLVAYDDYDSYLVVAADKGTAHFSDRANAVSAEFGFWLGDAFASGGSHGYDHKKLGITARGAWVSVQRHLYELDASHADKTLTVIGIGDMSGDVFGNGLLQSDNLRLLAAFDHRHIFLDPDPDPMLSFAERRRLFDLPRSSWADYAPGLISAGGGGFPQGCQGYSPFLGSSQLAGHASAVHRRTGLGANDSDGAGRFYCGVAASAPISKADGETHQQVGDRSNDNVRIDARQLKVKVVGEGGNLGLTQRARVEYSLCGGRINIDAVDNAGGVALFRSRG